MTKRLFFLLAVAFVCIVSSCSTNKDVAYMQDTVVGVPKVISNQNDIVARPQDKLSIVVNCSDPQTAALFSLYTPQKQFQTTTGDFSSTPTSNTSTGALSSYTVDDKGDITFPILGSLHVAGMTRSQIADMIKRDLINKDLVKDPIVVVNFSNLHVTVNGEVSNPGVYGISEDKLTLMEALTMAGDLTIYGRRDNVKVIREENGQRTAYQVDLRSENLFDSPVYYLQQNDIVYVEPNDARAGQADVSTNTWKTPTLWISIASLLSTIVVLIVK